MRSLFVTTTVHLLCRSGLDFVQGGLVKFGFNVPTHVLQAVDDTGIEDGVHSFHSVLKQQAAKQDGGQACLLYTSDAADD